MTSDPTTPEGRAELLSLLKNAMSGPFAVSDANGVWAHLLSLHRIEKDGWRERVASNIQIDDAALIAAALNALPVLLDALDRQERELAGYRAEEQRLREWNALVDEGNVRCTYCDLRYAEREEYSCGDARDQNPHHYDTDELADARRRALDGDS